MQERPVLFSSLTVSHASFRPPAAVPRARGGPASGLGEDISTGSPKWKEK